MGHHEKTVSFFAVFSKVLPFYTIGASCLYHPAGLLFIMADIQAEPPKANAGSGRQPAEKEWQTSMTGARMKRAMTEVIVRRGFHAIRRDPKRALRNLVDLGQETAGGSFRESSWAWPNRS